MSDDWKPPGPSAFDDNVWPEKLLARAVESGAHDDRLNGYEVLGDLAMHYRYSDVLYVALVGNTPDNRSSALFDLALASFATPSVAEAPVHIAVVSRLTGAPLASALSAGLIVAADQAHQLVAAHANLFAWLAAPSTPFPIAIVASDPWVATLRRLVLRIDSTLDLIRADMTRDAARLALLYAAGVQAPDQMEAAIVAARCGGIAAEAMATDPKDLGSYPVNLPSFRYVDDST